MEEKRRVLIAYGQKFYESNKSVPTMKDLTNIGLTSMQFRYIFSNLRDYHAACGLTSPIRKRNMTDDELRGYLLTLISREKTEGCPAAAQKDSICYQKCDCWVPNDRYITEHDRTNIRYNGEMWRLHRLSYHLFNGPISDNLLVLHLCDNSLCFNPEHLMLGDYIDNAADKHERGRYVHKAKEVADHNLRDPYNYAALVELAKERCEITSEGEWLYKFCKINGYPRISIGGKLYTFTKLMLANKLGKKYEEINVTRHLLKNGKPGQRHDLNPEHLQDGTKSQNAYDEVKLSKEIVTYIREAAPKLILKRGDATRFDQAMSEKFSVSTNTILNIRSGTSYGCYHDGKPVKINYSKRVQQLDAQGNLIREYASVAEALRVNNYKSKNMIQDVCNGISHTYMGYVWRYTN